MQCKSNSHDSPYVYESVCMDCKEKDCTYIPYVYESVCIAGVCVHIYMYEGIASQLESSN